MKRSHLKTPAYLLCISFFLGVFAFAGWQEIDGNETSINNNNTVLNDFEEKQRGAHVFGVNDTTYFQFLHRNNIEWVTIVPWGFQDKYDSPVLTHHNGDSVMIRDSDSGWLSQLEMVKKAGFKIFVKPHVWISHSSDDTWRSDIFPKSDADWELWKKGYRDFIYRYAAFAEKAEAEMFCIGTEFSRLAVEKPVFWKNLIQEVRGIYSGKLTYAANWYNEYEKITFWDDLDYIGIQAYFPLTNKEYPGVAEISKGWNKYLPSLKSVSKKYNRKVLFTELGYKSTSDSAIQPWEWIDDSEIRAQKVISAETQANCYQAFFNTLWSEKWFAGVHIWQFKSVYGKRNPGRPNMDFTPQGKLAEQVIAKGFGNK